MVDIHKFREIHHEQVGGTEMNRILEMFIGFAIFMTASYNIGYYLMEKKE